METSLKAIKGVAIDLLWLKPEPVPELPFLVRHPYFQNNVTVLPHSNQLIDIIQDEEALQKVSKLMQEQIEKSKSVMKIFMLLLPQYRLTFFKYVNQYLSDEDFKDMLLYSWIMVEKPSNDANVTQSEILKWFRQLNYVSNLSGVVEIYRGVTDESGRNGISWTLNKEKAEWFANRFKENGIVYRAKVKASNILYYIDDRDEDEIIVDPKKLMQIEKLCS